MKKEKNDFKKYFLNLRITKFLWKTMENVRKHRGMKLVTAGTRRNYLVLEPNYRKINFFSENSLAIEMRKTWILEMYQFWHDYEKTEYWEKAKLYDMDIDSV